MMTRRLMTAGLSILGLGGAGAACAQPASEDAMEALRNRHSTPALGGAIVTRDGLARLEVRGLRRSDGEAPVTVEDAWHLGSNTKAMTAALYGRLVEQGRARWDTGLPDLFPDLTVDAAWTPVTVQDLARHRAGLLDTPVLTRDWLMARHGDSRPVVQQRTETAAEALAIPPPGLMGEFVYGNLNYIVIGAAIERITGTSWEEAMRREVFEPLGMAGAGFGAPQGDQPWGHVRRFGVILTPLDPTGLADNPAALGPAGTVHAPLGDYARFLRVFMGGEQTWLSGETIQRLTMAPTADDPDYALGWGTRARSAWAQGPILGHEGSNTFWHAVTRVAPARGLAVVTVANVGGGQAPQALAQAWSDDLAAG